jgi:hypothetical protein
MMFGLAGESRPLLQCHNSFTMKYLTNLALLDGVTLGQLSIQSDADATSALANTPTVAPVNTTAPDAPLKPTVEVNFGADVDLLRKVSGGIATGGRAVIHLGMDRGMDPATAIGWRGIRVEFGF